MTSDDQLEFHLPAPPVTGDKPLIPARMVNEFVYCPRLAYLMWTQGEWAETGDTVEGKRVHGRVDRPTAPLPAPQALGPDEPPPGEKIVSRSLTLSSEKLGVIAKLMSPSRGRCSDAYRLQARPAPCAAGCLYGAHPDLSRRSY